MAKKKTEAAFEKCEGIDTRQLAGDLRRLAHMLDTGPVTEPVRVIAGNRLDDVGRAWWKFLEQRQKAKGHWEWQERRNLTEAETTERAYLLDAKIMLDAIRNGTNPAGAAVKLRHAADGITTAPPPADPLIQITTAAKCMCIAKQTIVRRLKAAGIETQPAPPPARRGAMAAKLSQIIDACAGASNMEEPIQRLLKRFAPPAK